MPFSSPYPDLDIPKTDVISYLFPTGVDPPDKPVWIDSGSNQSLSPRQLLQWVKRLAIGLDRLQVRPGEAVLIFTPNHIFVPVAYLGIVGSRRIFSGSNPGYTSPEVAHQIRNLGAKVILAHPTLIKTAIAAVKESGVADCQIFQFSEHENKPVLGIQDWRSMAGTVLEAETFTFQPMSAKEAQSTVATVNYSSGTTGLPKGVCISHASLIANAEQSIFMRLSCRGEKYASEQMRSQRWVGLLPLYHAYGQLYTILIAAKTRIPIYVMAHFHFEKFLATIQTHSITSLQVAPPILVMLNKRPEARNYDLSSIRDILCGGAPMSKELQNESSQRFNVQIYQGWGMTETVAGAIHVPVGHNDTSGSVGLLFPNTECMLLDDNGKEVEAGERGEIFMRGPHICMGYWKNKAATEESLSPDGWLKTGDIAIAKDGWLWIVDRKKELIKVNAFQVAPAELEAVLLENDDIADAAVVGITVDGEEWPRAYVHLKDSAKGRVNEDSIHRFMKGRVAKYKQLTGGIAFVDEVPKLQSGKIVRKVVKEWASRDALAMKKAPLAKI